MRKLLLFFSIIFIAVACEEDFDPKGDFRQEYVMNCILRIDTTHQICTISKSYEIDGMDPYANTLDPAIENAFIRIWYKDTVYIMRDTTVERKDLTRYTDSLKYFYLDDFQPELNQELEIEALLSNGKRLRATTQLPMQFTFTFGSDLQIPSTDGNETIAISWETGSGNMIYHNRLKVIYYNKGNKDRILTKYIPVQYVEKDGVDVPFYPIPDKRASAVYNMNEINRVMTEIGADVEDKSSIVVISAMLEVLAYDENLSGYYLSTLEGTDGFSVRLDQSDFSNVDGGFGVFGSYLRKNKSLLFDEDYIRSFGYLPK